MNEIDQLCLKYNILPSVIKDSRLPKSIFEKTYKFANVFRENLYKFDKKRVYKSFRDVGIDMNVPRDIM